MEMQKKTKNKKIQQIMVSMADLLLLPFKESDEQSGIVTDSKTTKRHDDACTGITMTTMMQTIMGDAEMRKMFDAMFMEICEKLMERKQANELLFVQQLEAMPWPLIPKQMLISFDDEVLITLIVVALIILIITKISHISDENIKTVNKKCDLIDYLTKTNLKVNYYDYYANSSTDKQAKIQHNKNYNNNNDQNMCIDIKGNQRTDKKTLQFSTFDELCQLQRNEKRIFAEAARQNKTIKMRLCGGGEGSLTNPTTGWGSPPNSQLNPGNPNAGSWGATNPPSQWGQGQTPGQQQRPLNSGPPGPDAGNKNQNSVPNPAQGPPNMAATVQQGQSGGGNSNAPNSNQAQAGNANSNANANNPPNNPQQQQQAPSGGGNNNGNFPAAGNAGAAGNNPPAGNGNNPAAQVPGGAPAATAKNQLEQLNTMREALFSQDGWSCSNVNQDTNWDVPGSPEPGLKSDPNTPVQPLWKTGMNNGTELWEANLKCGGQPPPAPVAKSQWTPKVPFGGTWGADDEEENAAGNTVWNTNQQNNPAQGWNQNQGPVGNAGFNAAPNAPKLENEWNANPGNNWGDLRQQPPQSDPRNLPANLMRDNSVGSGTGISGRLNPNNIDWAQNKGPMMGVGGVTPTNGQWAQTGPKDMPTGKPSGWVEGTSPPRIGRGPQMPDYNDGTNLWQQNQRGGVPGGNAGPHWKDMPDGSRPGNMPRPGVLAGAGNPGPIQSRLGPSGPMKQDVWQSGGARTSWDEPPHTSGGWDDGNKMPGGGGNANNAWDANCWTNKPKPTGWPDNDLGMGSDWAHGQKGPNKMVSSEMVRNSKQFRMLIDLGYKKEDAEVALRNTNSFEEAVDLLSQRNAAGGGNISDQWRRHDEHPNAFDHPPRFPGAPTPTMPFPPNSNPNILGNLGSNLTGNQINKMSQIPPNYAPPGSGPNFGQQPGSGTGANPQGGSSQPSTQQLRMLVQQIQTAVHAGFLNHQILNQPLAPQTLILLNQLLTCIKQLQLYQSNMNRPGVNAVQANIITSKLQQQIKTLQNQITAQQQMYVKQAPSNMPNPNDYLRSPTDPTGSLMTAFPDLNIGGKNDPGVFNQSISRLESQWKVGSKDSSDPSEFSRAPGTTAKSSISATPSIGLGSDSPWSSSVSGRDGGWPEPSNDSKDVDWPSQPSPAFSELVVPEFKPGEPWKGTQQKSIEDDPSITPGSVARSPLSIAAKESDLFSGASKTSPDIQPISLSNSTWSFTPSGQQSFSSAKATSNSTWSDTTPPIPKSMPSSAADLWSNNKAPRGPPPGLGSTKSAGGNGNGAASNNWMGLGALGGNRNSGTSGSGNWQASSGGSGWFSSWLLLKNLTAQIDGSTLRTLCMQHGPLQNFHLYLPHGIALCKYSSREEAQKAQTALNNCVLGNTTICAESPSESEVQSILQHLGAPSSGGNGGNPGGQGGNGNSASSGSAGLSQSSWRPQSQAGPRPTGGSDAWASSWPAGSSSGNLWTPIDGVPGERGTPSNLSTFLPENLLGTELN